MKIVLFLCAISMAAMLFGSGAHNMSLAKPRVEFYSFWGAAFFVLAGACLGIGAAILIFL